MTDTHTLDVLNALYSFASQRPGLEFGNYGDVKLYRQEQRSITRDLHDFKALKRAVELKSISANDIISESKSAFSGRLTITECGDRKIHIDYCTGQYFPTEYRKAACAVLVYTLWHYWRDCGCGTYEQIQKQARAELGRGIASRWFN